jgi:hypothetical protein
MQSKKLLTLCVELSWLACVANSMLLDCLRSHFDFCVEIMTLQV